ncbi:MAG: PRC-barrel domain-containing protein [Chloroflexota bacterium]|nr:PRC-barrel domain-containing protein [Chloroflexota bacterium]
MNYKALTGREVISIESGRKLGHVERILFDPATMQIDSIVIHPVIHSVLEEPSPMQQVPVARIRGLGQDVVTVESDDALQPLAEGGAHVANLVAFDQIENEAVVTESGKKIGEVDDIEFDDRSLQLQSIQIGRGLLARKSSIAASEIVSIGEDVIVVHDSADPDSHDQVGEQGAVEEFERVRIISDADRRDTSEG